MTWWEACPGAVGACPLGSIQNALASSGHHAGWYVLGIIMIFGLTLGRTICGWLCPVGLIQELLYRIPTPKIRKNRVTRALTYLKYVIIAIFVVSIPLYYGLKHDMHVPGFCKFICPAGTFEGAVGLLSNPKNASLFAMLKILFTRKFVIMMIIGLACIFCYRSFCRFRSRQRQGRRGPLQRLRRMRPYLQDGRAPCGRPRVHQLCGLHESVR